MTHPAARVAPKVVHETIDGETIIINLDSGTYYSRVGAGAEVWSLLEQGLADADILTAARHRYPAQGRSWSAALASCPPAWPRRG